MKRFADRADAGRQLAEALAGYRGCDVLVLGLPRGGFRWPIRWPPPSVRPRRAGGPQTRCSPTSRSWPSGRSARDPRVGENVRVLNEAVLRQTLLDAADIAAVEAEQRAELRRRIDRYRGGRPGPDPSGRTVLIIDDGFATGATARAAALVARAQGRQGWYWPRRSGPPTPSPGCTTLPTR